MSGAINYWSVIVVLFLTLCTMILTKPLTLLFFVEVCEYCGLSDSALLNCELCYNLCYGCFLFVCFTCVLLLLPGYSILGKKSAQQLFSMYYFSVSHVYYFSVYLLLPGHSVSHVYYFSV